MGYESLLERDRLWLADFDAQVWWVASQPLWLSGCDGAVLRRHVPDFLLETSTGYRVVDVKPADLAAGRRRELLDPDVLVKVAEAGRVGMTLAQAEAAADADQAVARAATVALLWSRRWATDLARPLSSASILSRVLRLQRSFRAGGMTTTPGLDLRVGGRVWFDGQGWEVSELTGSAVRLSCAGAVRTVSVTSLIDALREVDVAAVDEGSPRWDLPSVVLAGLDHRQREKLERTVAVLRRLLEPDAGDERSLGQRYEDLAGELG